MTDDVVAVSFIPTRPTTVVPVIKPQSSQISSGEFLAYLHNSGRIMAKERFVLRHFPITGYQVSPRCTPQSLLVVPEPCGAKLYKQERKARYSQTYILSLISCRNKGTN